MVTLAPPNETTHPSYLEILASLGMTRHLGAWNATKELARLCHIGKGKYILDVGCGIGKTACWFARRRGCRVVGVDVSPRMIEWAKQTARAEGVRDQTDFKAADACQLPFDHETFDAVTCESVLGFVPDKANTLRELIRVCKTGGYVGMNESTWLAEAVPPEIIGALEMGGFVGAKLNTVDEWRAILNASGLQDIVIKTYPTSANDDLMDRLKWFGFKGILRNILRMRAFAAASAANRAALTHFITLSRRIPSKFWDFYGYGSYVGRK